MGATAFGQLQRAKKSPLIGLSLCGFDSAFVDIAAHFGFDVIWIEMEHANMTMSEAEILCRIISGNGKLSLIRLPNGDRDTVLRAAEAGPDMLMLPMVNEPGDLERFAANARYAPAGKRGFHKLSRSMKFGLGDTVAELRRQANEKLMLWGQVETLAALENLSGICQVDQIDGLFVGPGDLSSAYGVPGQVSDPRVVEAIATVIGASHSHGKCSGTALPPSEITRWREQDIGLLMVGNNIGFYISAAEALRAQLDAAFSTTDGP
jgi:4-hydroxy-2-oxoheptanedioate aldolase